MGLEEVKWFDLYFGKREFLDGKCWLNFLLRPSPHSSSSSLIIFKLSDTWHRQVLLRSHHRDGNGMSVDVLGSILHSYLCAKLRRQLLRQHSIHHIINVLWWIGRISYNHLIADHCVSWSLKTNDGCRHFCVFHITFLRQDSIFFLLSEVAEDVSSRGRGVKGRKELKSSSSSVLVFLISPGTWNNTFRHIQSITIKHSYYNKYIWFKKKRYHTLFYFVFLFCFIAVVRMHKNVVKRLL